MEKTPWNASGEDASEQKGEKLTNCCLAFTGLTIGVGLGLICRAVCRSTSNFEA